MIQVHTSPGCSNCGERELLADGLCEICWKLTYGISQIQREREAKAFLIIMGVGVLLVIVLCAAYLWHPGGPLNKHDWLSHHLENDSYVPLYLELTDSRTGHPHKAEGWCVDFCAKHSEVRVTKAPCQNFVGVKP